MARVFSWGLVAALWAGGVTAVDHGLFGPAYASFALAGICALGFWLASNVVKKRHPARLKQKKREQLDAYLLRQKRAARQYRGLQIGGIIVVVTVEAWLIPKVYRAQQAHRLAALMELRQELKSGTNPAHTAPSSINDRLKKNPPPSNALRVWFGSNLAYMVGDSFRVLRISERDMLWVTRSRNGIMLNADVFSDDEQIVAEIRDNAFTVNPNNYFKIERADESSLAVFDLRGNEVLKVRFSNRYEIHVTGQFRYKGKSVVITDQHTEAPGGIKISNMLFSGDMEGALNVP